MDAVNSFVDTVNGFVWGPVMLVLLFGTHLFLTFRTRFIQRYTLKAIKLSVTPDHDAEGDVSGFGALTTALAATIGTGNIVGVATAVALGGPGAILWCWLTGLFGVGKRPRSEVVGCFICCVCRSSLFWYWQYDTGQFYFNNGFE